MELKDYKTSFNKLDKNYRVYRKDNIKGDWYRVTYGKETFESMLRCNKNLKDSIKPMPYKPYFKYMVIWFVKDIYKKIKEFEPKLKNIQKNGIIILLFGLTMWIVNYCTSKKQEYNPQTQRIIVEQRQTIQNYEILTESLEVETKKMELKEKHNQQVLKKYIEYNTKDSLNTLKLTK